MSDSLFPEADLSDASFWGLYQRLWDSHLGKPLNDLPRTPESFEAVMRAHFLVCKWYEVYDPLEWVSSEGDFGQWADDFRGRCNEVLEQECAAWRFVGERIAPIVEREEIVAIENAINDTESMLGVRGHLRTALRMLSDRQNPDYRNSIKESISAVEALARLVTGQPKATLGDALKVMRKAQRPPMHEALYQAFEKMYGYTSDEHGIRHAMLEQPNLGLSDAKFMLVACAAFISYVIAKCAEADIDLRNQ